jgi:hypothetical protein
MFFFSWLPWDQVATMLIIKVNDTKGNIIIYVLQIQQVNSTVVLF